MAAYVLLSSDDQRNPERTGHRPPSPINLQAPPENDLTIMGRMFGALITELKTGPGGVYDTQGSAFLYIASTDADFRHFLYRAFGWHLRSSDDLVDWLEKALLEGNPQKIIPVLGFLLRIREYAKCEESFQKIAMEIIESCEKDPLLFHRIVNEFRIKGGHLLNYRGLNDAHNIGSWLAVIRSPEDSLDDVKSAIIILETIQRELRLSSYVEPPKFDYALREEFPGTDSMEDVVRLMGGMHVVEEGEETPAMEE